MLGDNQKAWIVGGCALTGFALTLWCYFPGWMSPDSLDQLSQARGVIYSNWHPPLMAWIWRFGEYLVPDGGAILVFHATLFWAGGALFFSALDLKPLIAGALLLAFGFFPTVFALLGTAWKDVGLGVSLVFATGCLAQAQFRRRERLLVPAGAALFYAFAVRHNSPPAVLPFFVWGVGIILRNKRMSFVRTACISVLFAVICSGAFLGGAKALNSVLNRGATAFPEQVLFLYDIAGIAHHEGSMPILPQYLSGPGSPKTPEDLASIYNPGSSGTLFWGSAHLPRFPITANSAEIRELFDFWRGYVLSHFRSYLRHRLEVFRFFMSFDTPFVVYPFHIGITENQMGVVYRPTRPGRAVAAGLEDLRHTFFFRGWIFGALGLFVAAASMIRRNLPALGVSSSGLIYLGMSFFITPASDFRFMWWSVLSVFLSAALLCCSPKIN